MNVHPLLVHFPIAFLSLYALLELLRFTVFTKQPYWFYLKAVLLFMGVFSAGLAILAGLLIEQQFSNQGALLVLHKNINEIASFLFAVLAFSYLVSWLERTREFKMPSSLKSFWKLSLWIKHITLETWFLYVIVLAAFFLITIGSALGGIIVYGPNLDPFTQFIYRIFFGN